MDINTTTSTINANAETNTQKVSNKPIESDFSFQEEMKKVVDGYIEEVGSKSIEKSQKILNNNDKVFSLGVVSQDNEKLTAIDKTSKKIQTQATSGIVEKNTDSLAEVNRLLIKTPSVNSINSNVERKNNINIDNSVVNTDVDILESSVVNTDVDILESSVELLVPGENLQNVIADLQNNVINKNKTEFINVAMPQDVNIIETSKILPQEIRENLQTIIVKSKDNVKDVQNIEYTSITLDLNDAEFFVELVQDPEKTLQNVVADLQSNVESAVQETSKNVKVSAVLMNAISEAAKTNQPLRIDFDKDVSVIIKIDKDGSVNAKFIPGDKAVEEYLRQNISILRQRFDEQDISYRDLSYSRQSKHNQENNRRNNKENDHE